MRQARQLAMGQLVAGAALLAAPELVTRPQARAPGLTAGERVALRRMALRNIGSGLAGLAATNADAAATRGWLQVTALIDAGDVVLNASDRSMQPWARLLNAGIAGLVCAAALQAARELPRT